MREGLGVWYDTRPAEMCYVITIHDIARDRCTSWIAAVQELESLGMQHVQAVIAVSTAHDDACESIMKTH